MTPGEVFDDLWSTQLGSVFLSNLLDSRANGTLPAWAARSFVSEWLDLTSTYASITPSPSPMELIEASADAAGIEFSSPIKPVSLPSHIVTVFPAKFLTSRIEAIDTNFAGLARAIDKFYSAVDLIDLKRREAGIFEMIDVWPGACGNGLVEVDLPGGSLFNGGKKFAWFTSFGASDREEGFWKSRPEWGDRADLARDILGLIHLGSDSGSPSGWEKQLLAAYVIPTAALPAGTRYVRPNAIDGASGSRFRSRFGLKNDPTYGWGRAVDLRRFHGPRPHRGGREMIIEDFTPTQKIRVGVVGGIWAPRGDLLGKHDESFAELVVGRRWQSTSKKKFEKLA